MTKVKSLVSRRRLIGASLMIPLLALAIWHFNTRSTSAQGGFESAIFTVSPIGQTTSFAVSPSLPPGASFQMVGEITLVNERGQPLPGNDGSKGQFYRSGIVLDGGLSLVNDVYVLRTSNGAITATGILKGAVTGAMEMGADLLAVTGGVGTFRSATGEAQLMTTDAATGKFTVRLEEGLRRLGQFQ